VTILLPAFWDKKQSFHNSLPSQTNQMPVTVGPLTAMTALLITLGMGEGNYSLLLGFLNLNHIIAPRQHCK